MGLHGKILFSTVATVLLACQSSPPDAGVDSGVPEGGVDGLTVMTTRGLVTGKRAGDVLAFLGIPYAAPPVGPLRWRPPLEPERWDARTATQFGAACPQGADEVSGEALDVSEDCLTVNVWTPTTAQDASLPVMVFLHGGGFQTGSGGNPKFDGTRLATQQVVVVTLNYRLAQLGFLAHPALSAEDEHHSSGNYGLLDQQAALRWVRENAAAFGGAPDRVTLFGESAGSLSVCAHTASPVAAGLFQRAIGQSGACAFLTTPLRVPGDSALKSAEWLGGEVARILGCDTAPDVLACMRGKPVADVLAVPPPSARGEPKYEPNVDGYVLPEPVWTALETGRGNPLDGFIAGTTQDEATAFTRSLAIETAADYKTGVAALVPGHEEEVLSLYPVASYPTPKAAFSAFVTDLTFICPTRAQTLLLAAHGTPSYLYLFTKQTPFGTASGLGVYHSSELPFVFGNLIARSGNTPSDRALSDLMMGYWVGFAKTSTPSVAGAPEWPRFSRSDDAFLELGEHTQPGTALHSTQCNTILGWQTTL
jgi:para-nitrobenzyl esterase